jgi:glycosyltransferase involved in cell wall biosynthesis
LLAASDICLVLLRDEPVFRTAVPTKMLEYLASGRPVISTVQGDAADLLERSGGGMTVRAGDSDALANAVLGLRSDTALRERMGASGRRYVEQHSTWDQRAEQYLALLLRLVRGSGRRVG